MSEKVYVTDAVPVKDLSVEAQMTVTGQALVKKAQEMRIVTAEEYEQAGVALRQIKEQANRVKDYWAGPKKAAQSAHKEIVEKEKAMLKFFADAEGYIKASMKVYLDAVERARREEAEAAKRRQEEEAMRLVEQAAAAEEAGDEQAAAVSMAMAQMVSDMAAPAAVEAPKAQGISARKTWKARVVDAEKVPAYFGGMEIRTVNLSALNGIAKMSKGTAQISGVEFYEDVTVSARV